MTKYLWKKKWKAAVYVVALCIAQILGTGFAFVMSALVDCANKGMETVLKTLAASLIYVVVCVLFEMLYAYFKNLLETDARRELKSGLFAAIMKRPVSKFKSGNTAEYINELSNNMSMYEELYINNILTVPGLIVQFLTASVFCIYIEPLMLLLMIALAVVTWLTTKVTKKPLEKSSQNLAEASQEYLAEIKDDFTGHQLVHNFSILSLILQRQERANVKMEKAKYSLTNAQIVCMYAGELVGLASTVFIMGIAAYYVAKGTFSIGLVIAFGHLIGHVVSPITQLPSVLANFKAALPLTKRFLSILQETYEEGEMEKPEFCNAICLTKVGFSYNSERHILNGFDAVFEKNRKYAIIGESGAGKSTLFALLQGLYKNYTGSIRIDNAEVKDRNETALQPLFGVVTQETFLFNDTLRNNLTMFRDSFSEEEIREAIWKAGLADFISKLPDGMETIINENGKNLSGGEKQRIALARVLLDKKPVMLLDEPTANLDEKNTKEIEEQIFAMKDCTILMITHDLDETVLRRFDRVIKIPSGALA